MLMIKRFELLCESISAQILYRVKPRVHKYFCVMLCIHKYSLCYRAAQKPSGPIDPSWSDQIVICVHKTGPFSCFLKPFTEMTLLKLLLAYNNHLKFNCVNTPYSTFYWLKCILSLSMFYFGLHMCVCMDTHIHIWRSCKEAQVWSCQQFQILYSKKLKT